MKACDTCGRKIDLGWIEKHHIIPIEVTQQAGLPESRIATLCHDCHHELHSWYSVKVAPMAYNTKAKRFETKSWLGLSKEYESTFNSFIRHKREQT